MFIFVSGYTLPRWVPSITAYLQMQYTQLF